MRAVDRTLRQFRASLAEALPDVRTQVSRSTNRAGHSRYVYIHLTDWTAKVRISDHGVGMRRALSGECSLFIAAGAKPSSWAVWLGELVAREAAVKASVRSSGWFPDRSCT